MTILMIFMRVLLLSLLSLSLFNCQKNERIEPQNAKDYSLEETGLPPIKSQDKSSLYIVHKDSEKIAKILADSNLLELAKKWQLKATFIRVKEDSQPIQLNYYYYNSVVKDINNNKIQDEPDLGFFNPASTLKVGISALVLEKLNRLNIDKETQYKIVGSNRWYSLAEDITKTLVISDNEATNRLILFLGFNEINQRMESLGLKSFSVNRLMLNKGTLIDSPGFELRTKKNIIQQPPQTVNIKSDCWEIGQKIGNCASAQDLAEILVRLVQPELYLPEKRFELRESDRLWLQETMAKTPQEIGLNYEHTFCRFLHPLAETISKQKGKLLSKCGVGLFSHTFVDTSFLETDKKYYIVLAITPPRNISKQQAINWFNKTTKFILQALD